MIDPLEDFPGSFSRFACEPAYFPYPFTTTPSEITLRIPFQCLSIAADGEAGDLSSPESGTHHGGVTIANRDIPKVIEQRGLKARLGQLANSIMAPPPPTT